MHNDMCNLSRFEDAPGDTTTQITIDWYASEDERHPFLAFLVAKEIGGVFRQVSNWSYVKHTFSALTNECASAPAVCINPLTNQLFGRFCKDTYHAYTNALKKWLGPPGRNQRLDWRMDLQRLHVRLWYW